MSIKNLRLNHLDHDATAKDHISSAFRQHQLNEAIYSTRQTRSNARRKLSSRQLICLGP